MTASIAGIGFGGWLVTCTPCRWEFYSPRRPTADKAAHEHNKSNHKENTNG